MDHADIPIRLYRPGNGAEGECFQAAFCERCVKDRAANQRQEYENGCKILADTYFYGVDEPGYPTQWIEVGGEPQCTAFAEDIGQKWPPDATAIELEAAGQQRLL